MLVLASWLAPLARGANAAGPAWQSIAPFFKPPAEFANQFGDYRSPLLFNDGTRVESATDWPRRREEILRQWNGLMGPWPPALERPKLEILLSTNRENFVQRRVRLEIGPGQTGEGWLLMPRGQGPFAAVLVVYYEPETSVGLGKEPRRDFGLQLARRGFVTLSIGTPGGDARNPDSGEARCQPLSYQAYVAANCWQALANLPEVDRRRIGIVGHSYGGKWALFAGALCEKFACVAVSDPGIVFDETRPNVNYWEPWYLGFDPREKRPHAGIPTAENPRTGSYRQMIETGRDLHELHALIAPRPFFVSGGAEDPLSRWTALNHAVALNQVLGFTDRVAMTSRQEHAPSEESNAQLFAFFDHFLKEQPAHAAGSMPAADGLAGFDIKKTALYRRVKAQLDAVPAIDTHDHLMPFEQIRGRVQTERGFGMSLYSLWQSSYYTWFNPLTAWPESGRFEDWWPKAKHDFTAARATGFYRYQLPAFTDLYGVDFDTMTDAEARVLDERIFRNYQNPRWVDDVITNRANIELMFVDPYWARFAFTNPYPYSVLVLNVTTLIGGTQPSAFPPNESLVRFAGSERLKLDTLDDYLAVIERLLQKGKAAGGVCLKTTSAYQRTLQFDDVPKREAATAYGRPRSQLSAGEIKAFEDYVMWRIVELSAKLDLPFQIHTGHARIQGSNPMLLLDLIAGNPKTKFILFHGGYPWIGETGAIATRHKNVWIDSVWLPTISYTMAKRAYQEWLEVVPSNRIMWGADAHHAEGIYAATEVTRRCLAEALTEKVERGELGELNALRIGRQILRDNALELFPQLQGRLGRPRGKP